MNFPKILDSAISMYHQAYESLNMTARMCGTHFNMFMVGKQFPISVIILSAVGQRTNFCTTSDIKATYVLVQVTSKSILEKHVMHHDKQRPISNKLGRYESRFPCAKKIALSDIARQISAQNVPISYYTGLKSML
jgi:hypothetical protein